MHHSSSWNSPSYITKPTVPIIVEPFITINHWQINITKAVSDHFLPHQIKDGVRDIWSADDVRRPQLDTDLSLSAYVMLKQSLAAELLAAEPALSCLWKLDHYHFYYTINTN